MGLAYHHPAGGTVSKRIFSITCTTCQARLAVRSEAAIGTILECPRCQSMVQVLPPPGWTPAVLATQIASSALGQTGTSAPPAGPPPLDHVAADPLTLELDLPEVTLWDRLLGRNWLLWASLRWQPSRSFWRSCGWHPLDPNPRRFRSRPNAPQR